MVTAALPHVDDVRAAHDRMTQEQLVDQIRAINPGARVEYLLGFRPAALDQYLRHLQCAAEPRGRGSRWVRGGDEPAIRLSVIDED
jgi:hypothetical protein